MSQPGSTSEISKIGGYLSTVGGGIEAAAQTLPDTTIGSPRNVAMAVGALLLAVGGYLVARGH